MHKHGEPPGKPESAEPADMEDGDASELFSAAMEDVSRISKGRKGRQLPTTRAQATSTHLARREAALGIQQSQQDENFLTLGEVVSRAPLEYLEWKKDGVQRAVFDKLRRGDYDIEDSLDLHRKTVKEARQLVFGFIRQASRRAQRSLLISPGKGAFSTTPARLKSYLAAWLEQHPEVIAFCSSQRQHGGVGSVYVLIRKSDASRELNREQHGGKSDFE